MIPPEKKMFTPGQVALAAFLGTPLPGFYLLARNYRNAGKTVNASLMLALGIVVTALLVAIGFHLSAGKPSTLISVISTVFPYQIAKSAQGQLLRHHVSSGGRISSWWSVVGYSAVGFVAVAGIVIVITLLQPDE